MNRQYLDAVRDRTCYPTFRAFVAIATVLAYLIAVVSAIAGFLSGGLPGGIIGVVVALVVVLLAKVGQEVSLMIADIADATIDTAAKRDRKSVV